jgi:hypothetical protein
VQNCGTEEIQSFPFIISLARQPYIKIKGKKERKLASPKTSQDRWCLQGHDKKGNPVIILANKSN